MDLVYIDKESAKSVVDNLGIIISGIDGQFGSGYAKENPALVGQMLRAASIDYFGTLLHFDLDELKDVISSFQTED